MDTNNQNSKHKIPLLLKVISISIILAPIVNTIYNSYDPVNIPLLSVLKEYDISSIILLAFFPVIGFSLLSLKRWSWYLFVFFSFAILTNNVISIIQYPSSYYFRLLAFSLLLLLTTAYFLQKDIYAPFLAKEKRGFRQAKRFATEIYVVINGQQYRTIDISSTGMRLHCPSCPKNAGDSLDISFLMHSKPVEIIGEIVAIRGDEVAIDFKEIKGQKINPKKI